MGLRHHGGSGSTTLFGGGLVLQPQQHYAGGQDGDGEGEDRPQHGEGGPASKKIDIEDCPQQREGGTDAGEVNVPSPGYEPEEPIETPDKDNDCEEESNPEQGEERSTMMMCWSMYHQPTRK